MRSNAWWLCAAALAMGTPAFAAPTDPAAVEEVRSLGTTGLAKYDQGDFAGALADFDRAKAILYTPTLELFAARALVSMGRLVEASARYDGVIGTALAPDASDAFRKAVDDAKQERATLESRIPRITVQVEPPGPAEVLIDGRPASPGTAVEIDPGAHVVTATRGSDTQQSDVQVGEGERPNVTLRFAPAPADVDGPATTDDGSLQRTLGWIAVGVGAAGIGVGIGTGIAAAGKKGDLEDGGCTPDACPAGPFDDEVDSYNSLRTVSSIGFIAGAVVAAGGVVLLLTAPSGASAAGDPAATALRVRVGPAGVGAQLSF